MGAAAEPLIASQSDVVEKLKAGLSSSKVKLEELKTKRDSLVARQKSAQAQSQLHDALGSINLLDPTSEISRFEDKVRREEARVAGEQELAASSIDAQFEELDRSGANLEVEARLAALKKGAAPTA